ncbi:phosphate acetyltransferase [Phreatobacter aquaticus]|uniref:Phosphate acetyltransferase n=1 Tax=Phreatobacter aquaticus TaxID=2570229 RepID=A0A4D7QDU2_9HYPH|nr:phosphate acetyltransferase [Phreatobacter aquaticus]QCK84631.1 phosphate acetyltransferase [Phreatobacter aquaticus]
MKVGDRASRSRSYTAADIADFARLAGAAPSHITAIPEPLIGALFSYLLGVELPGPGTNYLKQEIAFHAAARLDEEVTATVEITRLRPDKHLCDLATTLTGADGRLIASGRALVLIKDVAKPVEA